MEILDVTRKLIGPIEATGQHEVDVKRLANLEEMIAVVHGLLEDITYAARSRNNYQDSMKAIGKKAHGALKEFGIEGSDE